MSPRRETATCPWNDPLRLPRPHTRPSWPSKKNTRKKNKNTRKTLCNSWNMLRTEIERLQVTEKFYCSMNKSIIEYITQCVQTAKRTQDPKKDKQETKLNVKVSYGHNMRVWHCFVEITEQEQHKKRLCKHTRDFIQQVCMKQCQMRLIFTLPGDS